MNIALYLSSSGILVKRKPVVSFPPPLSPSLVKGKNGHSFVNHYSCYGRPIVFCSDLSKFDWFLSTCDRLLHLYTTTCL